MANRFIPIVPDLFLEHKGVKVYHTYHGNDRNIPMANIFTLHKEASNASEQRTLKLRFNAANLTSITGRSIYQEHRNACFSVPEDVDDVTEFRRKAINAWVSRLEAEALRATIIRAIDEGVLEPISS